MLGALSLGKNYYGVDTNPKLVEKLKECANDFNAVNGTNLVSDVRCVGSEILQEDLVGKMGLCFSSPPYFNLEIYEGENTSTNLYGDNYKHWVRGYLAPTIWNCKEYLVSGGYFTMNIANGLNGLNLYDDAKTIASAIGGLKFIGEEELFERNGRQNFTKQNKYQEKIMVFQKDTTCR